MKRLAFAFIPAFLGLLVMAGSAGAQQKPLKDQLIGTWTLVSSNAYGEKPLGIQMFDASGHFAVILLRADVPKYTANNRLQATPAEQKATVDGSLASFGTYSVEGTDLKVHFDGSTFPNWKGADQKRTNVTVNGDEFRYTVPAPSGGGVSSELVWRRAK